MAKIVNPHSVSTAFKVELAVLQKLGVLDATLSADTRLFIDPLLFQVSAQPELNKSAIEQYRAYFEHLAKLLAAAPKDEPDNAANKAVRRLLHFRELPTCLGYGASSDEGSAWGPLLIKQVAQTGKQIVDIGITDPDLFVSLALFEDGIGPDLISDMATNVAFDAIVAFNQRIIGELGLTAQAQPFEIDVAGTTKKKVSLLPNPYLNKTPVLLVPTDVLRKLPIAKDWDSVAVAAAQTDAIRDSVNKHISHIWEKRTNREKKKLREQALANQESFNALLAAIHAVSKAAYNSASDPDALTAWATIAAKAATDNPLDLTAYQKLADAVAVHHVVTAITAQFRWMVEERGLWRDLYKEDGHPRHEATAQRLYFAMAYAYCHANNIDISPEMDTGSGRIDFKFSKGFKARVVVEIKLSTNNKVVAGFEKQLEIYKAAEETDRGIYVVVNVGGMGKKAKNLSQLRNDKIAIGEKVSDLVFVNALQKVSASKQ